MPPRALENVLVDGVLLSLKPEFIRGRGLPLDESARVEAALSRTRAWNLACKRASPLMDEGDRAWAQEGHEEEVVEVLVDRYLETLAKRRSR